MYALRRVAQRIKPPPVLNVHAVQNARRPLSNLASPRARDRRVRLGALALTGTLGTSAYLYLHSPISLDASSTSPSELDKNDAKGRPRLPRDAHQEPLSSLIRTYIVYSMCSIPWLVDYSPKILSVLTSIPVVKQVTEVIVRVTFFAQFVGGETALETLPVLERLRAENKGAMLCFSAEVDEAEASSPSSSSRTSSGKRTVNKEIVDEIIQCIDVAGDFEDSRLAKSGRTRTGTRMEGRKTWVAIKLTALIPNPNTFINFSKHLILTRPRLSSSSSQHIPFPGISHPTDLDILTADAFDLPPTCPLTKEDLESLNALKEELFRVCKRAKERGVVVCVDAEHSWYQPAIEAFQLVLMREFNRPDSTTNQLDSSSHPLPSIQPLVYGTFQTYLRRAYEHLDRSVRDADEGGYALGVKLVRGAYHSLETSSHNSRPRPRSPGNATETGSNTSMSTSTSMSISPDPLPPVWQTKAETDGCFDRCARMLVGRVAEDVRASSIHDKSTMTKEGGARIGLIFGTHNSSSCSLVLNALLAEGLAARQINDNEGKSDDADNGEAKIEISKEALARVAVGQLYGMCDALSSSLARRTDVGSASISPTASNDDFDEPESESEPFVMKYIPYGPLARVMPYLSRRAIENKSVLSGENGTNGNGNGNGSAKAERERAGREIWRRLRVWFGFA